MMRYTIAYNNFLSIDQSGYYAEDHDIITVALSMQLWNLFTSCSFPYFFVSSRQYPSARPSARRSLYPVAMSASRGAFILFEGVDRCGKTTQSTLLSEYLASKGWLSRLSIFAKHIWYQCVIFLVICDRQRRKNEFPWPYIFSRKNDQLLSD